MQLKRLFAYLINSNRKCVEAQKVTAALVDDFGNPIKMGEQRDVGEFNINFLSRVHEALELASPEKTTTATPLLDIAALSASRELTRSVAMGMSVLLPVTPEQLSKSFVYSTFFGSAVILTSAKEKNGEPVELQTQSTFGQVIVNAEEDNLYRGWQRNYYSEIEDFQTPKVRLAAGMCRVSSPRPASNIG